ncbi:unnamed protein product [Caenorhabditis sp. 36 PRJEB53466]|nr:unnamed protein product [Caenorhabditis sp. 36 PRJEB53466]
MRIQNEEKLHLILEDVFLDEKEPPLSQRHQATHSSTKRKFFLLTVILVLVFLIYASSRPTIDENVMRQGSEAPVAQKPERTTTTEAPLPPLEPGVLEDPTRRLTRILPVSHVFISSVYYYPTSKSLGPNAIAMSMAVDSKNFNVKNATYSVVGSNGTHTELSVATSQTEGVPTCRYAPAMARTNTVANLTKLEMESNGVKIEIPFKMARYTAPSPVIICISPQFVAEQWQMFLMHVHAAHRFGGHLHVYVTSMIAAYFELMKEYEREGYMTLDFWLRMKFTHSQTAYFEPNANVEWRNQAGAETDCLLQYKVGSTFGRVVDVCLGGGTVHCILRHGRYSVPKNYPTYLQEFNAEWALQPNSSSILYGRREHEFVKAETLSEFSFIELVDSLKSSPLVKRGKVVVKPERYNSTWIHYSQHEDLSTRHKVEHPSLVHVQRPLQKHSDNKMTTLWKMEFGQLNETIRADDVAAIEADIWRMRNLSQVALISQNLPDKDFYLPIVFKCYYDAFYGPVMVEGKGLDHCPNADLCDLPQREDYKCIHSDAEYFSGPHMEPFTYHFSNNSHWSKNIGCYQ